MKIRNSTALITGGASGLGAATAQALHHRGARVVLCDISEEGGQAQATQLGEGALFVKTDVTSESSVQAAIAKATEAFGDIHVAISCAGILVGERILGKTAVHRLETFRRVIEVNLIGTFNVFRLLAEAMSKNTPTEEGERGVIIGTASIASAEGQVGQAAYSASKAGVSGLVLPTARELARFGIRVCAISPGVFDTAMLGGVPDELRAALAAQVPFPPRLGRPDEYAELAVAIIENTMLNGTTIRLDGAMRMSAR